MKEGLVKLIRQLFKYSDVLTSLVMAAVCLRYWIAPAPEDGENIYMLTVFLMFDFILLHSGAFMAFVTGKIGIFIFFPLYGLFALAFAIMAGTSQILWLYLFVVLNRMRFAFFNQGSKAAIVNFKVSFFRAFVWFFSLLFVVLIADLLPELGHKGMAFPDIGGDVFDKTHVAMFFGVFYNLALAVFEYSAVRYAHKLTRPMWN